MRAILVHGMGRSPLSQLLLAKRLDAAGIRVHLFGYSILRPFAVSLRRLVERVRTLAGSEPFVMIGHSYGCVLIRASLAYLDGVQPAACFLLAPPNKVPRAARFFGKSPVFRLLTQDAGRLLSDEAFMAALPVPAGPVKVYAGTAGYTGPRSPFKDEPNDGILAVSETLLSPSHAPMLVPVLHTFIMNSAVVASDIVSTVESLHADQGSKS
jgi:pimeloyl-ACP methyl ester carboxylesterase